MYATLTQSAGRYSVVTIWKGRRERFQSHIFSVWTPIHWICATEPGQLELSPSEKWCCMMVAWWLVGTNGWDVLWLRHTAKCGLFIIGLLLRKLIGTFNIANVFVRSRHDSGASNWRTKQKKIVRERVLNKLGRCFCWGVCIRCAWSVSRPYLWS